MPWNSCEIPQTLKNKLFLASKFNLSWAVLGPSGGCLVLFWAVLGPSWSFLGPVFGCLSVSCAVLCPQPAPIRQSRYRICKNKAPRDLGKGTRMVLHRIISTTTTSTTLHSSTRTSGVVRLPQLVEVQRSRHVF